MNGVIFLTGNSGMCTESVDEEEEEEPGDRVFCSTHYPDTPTQDAWTLTAWWLEKDDNRVWFGPKFGFLAAFFPMEKLTEIVGEDLPAYIVFVAGPNGSPGSLMFPDKATAREQMLEMADGTVVAEDNEHDGLTFTFKADDRPEPIVVGYAVKLT